MEIDLDRISVYFTCALCNEFFRNAVTLTECVHSFCEKCVMDYLDAVSASCPTCQTAVIYTQVKPDTSIRSLLNKFFGDELVATNSSPSLPPSVQATPRITQAPSKPPPPPQSQQKPSSAESNESNTKRIKQEEQQPKAAAQAKDSEEKLSLLLAHQHSSHNPLLITLPLHYTVKSVGKYLGKKRNVEATAWTCNGNVLPMTLTVGQAKQMYWRPDQDKDMVWIFQTKNDAAAQS